MRPAIITSTVPSTRRTAVEAKNASTARKGPIVVRRRWLRLTISRGALRRNSGRTNASAGPARGVARPVSSPAEPDLLTFSFLAPSGAPGHTPSGGRAHENLPSVVVAHPGGRAALDGRSRPADARRSRGAPRRQRHRHHPLLRLQRVQEASSHRRRVPDGRLFRGAPSR